MDQIKKKQSKPDKSSAAVCPWPLVALGSVCKLQNGYAFKSKEFVNHGTPVIRISNIKNGVVEVIGAVKIAPNKRFSEFKILKGDLLIAMSGATTGKMGIHTSDEPAYLNQRVGNLKITQPNKILATYRNYALKQLSSIILIKSYGAAQPNISPTQIHDLKIPLPPLKVQRQIVADVEAMQKQTDELKQMYTAKIKDLAELKKIVLNRALTGRTIS